MRNRKNKSVKRGKKFIGMEQNKKNWSKEEKSKKISNLNSVILLAALTTSFSLSSSYFPSFSHFTFHSAFLFYHHYLQFVFPSLLQFFLFCFIPIHFFPLFTDLFLRFLIFLSFFSLHVISRFLTVIQRVLLLSL